MPAGIQFLRYGFAGGASVLTHVFVLYLLVETVQTDKTLASAIGFACAIPVNYLLQHSFVFERNGRHQQYFFRYIAVTLAAMGLNTALFNIGVTVFHFNYLATQIAVIALVFVVNFAINRTFTFTCDSAR